MKFASAIPVCWHVPLDQAMIMFFLFQFPIRGCSPAPRDTTHLGVLPCQKKYKMLESDPTFCHPDDAIEITDHMMPDEIADIFTRSKLFYCYENSALALEAGLCNCPTVFIKNKNFTDLIADPEDSQDGVAFSDDPAEIEMARLSVGSIYPKFIAAQKTFWHQLDHFVTLTQQHAARRTYPTKISIDTFEKREIKRSASSRKTPLQVPTGQASSKAYRLRTLNFAKVPIRTRTPVGLGLPRPYPANPIPVSRIDWRPRPSRRTLNKQKYHLRIYGLPN